MIHSQYSYAKDTRSDDKYKADFDSGTYNQKLAIEQLIIDRYLQYDIQLNYIENPDKSFQNTEGYWEYNPDYIVINGQDIIPTEVKVQMAQLTDTIDLKASQIDKLIKLKGAVLYATKTKYCLVFAQYIKKVGKLLVSERFGNKKVYQVDTDKLIWNDWVHYPEFKAYKNEYHRHRIRRAD